MVTILTKNILKADNTKLGADNMPKLKKKSFLFYLLHPRTLKPALCPSLCPSSPFLSSSSSSILPEGPVVKAGLKLSMVKDDSEFIILPPLPPVCCNYRMHHHAKFMKTQDFVHGNQASYHLSYIPSTLMDTFNENFKFNQVKRITTTL